MEWSKSSKEKIQMYGSRIKGATQNEMDQNPVLNELKRIYIYIMEIRDDDL